MNLSREAAAFDRWLTTEPERDRCAWCGQIECSDACDCVECEIDREIEEK
jgi:hypothetical protein